MQHFLDTLPDTARRVLREKLASGAAIVIDGATGSELQARGAPISAIAWTASASLSHYETLVDVHADYIRAGADVITANTFATNRFVLEAAGLGAQYERINEAAMAAAVAARDAAGKPIAVAGSISCLPPGFDVQNYPGERAEKAGYLELAETLAALGADLLMLEMMEDARHSRWALEAVKSVGLPVWLGVSGRMSSTRDTVVAYDFPDISLRECLEALLDLAPDVVSIMHTPCDAVAPSVEILRGLWHGPMGAYPEVGSFDAVRRERTAHTSPSELAAYALDWYRLGVRVFGACCGSHPVHITSLRNAIDAAEARTAASGSAS